MSRQMGVVSQGQGSDGWMTSTGITGCVSQESALEKELHVQKQTTPIERRPTASVTKTGPAAPVILSPARSSHLKQRKTCLVHHRGILDTAKAPEQAVEYEQELEREG